MNPRGTMACLMECANGFRSVYLRWCLKGRNQMWVGRQGVVVMRALSRDIGQPTYFTHPELLAKDEVLPGVHKLEFAQRRTNLMEQISCSHAGMSHDKHVVIISGAPLKYMSADVPYRFHQHTDLLYLCGSTEPDCVLVLEAAGDSPLPQHKSFLYVRPRDPHKELWDGPRAGAEDTVEFTGVDEAYCLEELGQHLESRYSTAGYIIWYNSSEDTPSHPKHDELITNSLTCLPNSKIKEVHSPTHLVSRLRLVKSDAEVSLMRRAGELASHAFKAAMRGSHAGVRENELESIFEHSVKMNGAQWMSYPPVVAGGNRANCLHYIANDKVVREGEMVLMDAGCEYHGYVSDVTRTWPIAGKFSDAQRDLYEVVRETKQELTQLCRSGVTLNYLHSVAQDIMISQLKDMQLLSPRWSSSQIVQVIGQLLPHHVGHWLGLDTHDCLSMDRNRLLVPGMVLTLEPGLYLSHNLAASIDTPAARELAGTGIRLEDNVLVTTGAAEVLNQGCPETLQELTQLIGSSSD